VIRALVRVLLLGLAFALATRVLGWWGVPLTAALWGVLSPDTDGGVAALGACLGWAGLLYRDHTFGPIGTLASDLGTLFHLPPLVLFVLTLLFPAVLAWSAAVIGGAGRSTLTSPRPTQ
jgi:hypothetical protein